MPTFIISTGTLITRNYLATKESIFRTDGITLIKIYWLLIIEESLNLVKG